MLLQEREVMIKQTPVGSLPRSPELQEAFNAFDDNNLKKAELDKLIDVEIKDVVTNYEKIDGNPIITTGAVSYTHLTLPTILLV